jgi:DNA polymerase/3'-5' exonuclease PolX
MLRQTGRVFRYFIVPSLVGAAWLALPSPNAEARPQYFEQFKKTYEPLAEQIAEKKCAVCHGMGKKTERNLYGKAVLAAMGAETKNLKDMKAVEKALKQAEEKESSTKGKTFGALIKAGQLPE